MKQITNYINEVLHLNKNSKAKRQCPKDRNELREIIKYRLRTNKDAYLNDIDVSQITDMHRLFINLDPHNIDISEWDVSNVKDMIQMFLGCGSFECDLSKWDVSKVENMNNMFYGCEEFTGKGLDKWNVSKNIDMRNMFGECDKIKNIPNWYK